MEYILKLDSNSGLWCVLGRRTGADFWQQFGRWYKARGWAEKARKRCEKNYIESLRKEKNV